MSEQLPHIAIDTHYDSRSDTTVHSILHIVDLSRSTEHTVVIFKWPFKGRHYLSAEEIAFLNRQAIKILNKKESKS